MTQKFRSIIRLVFKCWKGFFFFFFLNFVLGLGIFSPMFFWASLLYIENPSDQQYKKCRYANYKIISHEGTTNLQLESWNEKIQPTTIL